MPEFKPNKYRSYHISFSHQYPGNKYRTNTAFTVVCDTAQQTIDLVTLYYTDVEIHNINRNAKDIILLPDCFCFEKEDIQSAE